MRFIQSGSRLSFVMISIILTGCATNTNPKEGDIFSSVYKLGTGAYEERVTNMEAEKEKALDEQQRIEREQQGLQTQEAQTQEEIAQFNQKIDDISEQAHSLAVRIDRIESQNTAMENQKADLDQQLTQLNAKIEQLKQLAAQREADAITMETYQEQAAQLEQELEVLLDRYQTLAN
jgi:chromosome segregation ATPase